MSDDNVIPFGKYKSQPSNEEGELIIWKIGDTLLDRLRAMGVGCRKVQLSTLRVQAEAEREALARGHTVCFWLLGRGYELIGTMKNLGAAREVMADLHRKTGRGFGITVEESCREELVRLSFLGVVTPE